MHFITTKVFCCTSTYFPFDHVFLLQDDNLTFVHCVICYSNQCLCHSNQYCHILPEVWIIALQCTYINDKYYIIIN